MSNAPPELNAEELVAMRQIEEASWRGRGARMQKTPLRDRLKRRGLIYSRPPNANPGMRSVAGHAYQWEMTPLGREAFAYATKPGV